MFEFFVFIVAMINCWKETEALVPLTLTQEELKGKKILGVKMYSRTNIVAKIYICFSVLFLLSILFFNIGYLLQDA